MIHHYVYETYSEFDGRRYIGCRSCKCDPSEDNYMGSFKDRSYKPTKKTILQTFDSRADALAYEIYLHDLYDVARNPEFANRAKQTSTKFSTHGMSIGAEGGLKTKELKLGIFNPNFRPGHHAKKEFIVTFPNGNEERILGLRDFCRKHGLHHQNLGQVAKGKISQHKGFRCRYV